MLALLFLAACSPERAAPAVEPLVASLSGEAFGTTWTAKWHGVPLEEAVAHAAIERTLERIDQRMSTWREDSELSRVREGGRVHVSGETAHVVEAALALSTVTGGAFDPTVQPLMEAWGFQGSRGPEAPSMDILERARAQVGWQRVSVTHADGESFIDAGGAALDLSAIAKGHAVDEVARALMDLGAPHLMVEIGGEVRTHGVAPGGGAWRLGIDLPKVTSHEGRPLAGVISMENGALATSGNYRNKREYSGQVVFHIMDPRIGKPASSPVGSVSVVAPDCRTADGWATALMVLGLEEGRALVEREPGLEALWLLAEPESFRAEMTEGMKGLWADVSPKTP